MLQSNSVTDHQDSNNEKQEKSAGLSSLNGTASDNIVNDTDNDVPSLEPDSKNKKQVESVDSTGIVNGDNTDFEWDNTGMYVSDNSTQNTSENLSRRNSCSNPTNLPSNIESDGDNEAGSEDNKSIASKTEEDSNINACNNVNDAIEKGNNNATLYTNTVAVSISSKPTSPVHSQNNNQDSKGVATERDNKKKQHRSTEGKKVLKTKKQRNKGSFLANGLSQISKKSIEKSTPLVSTIKKPSFLPLILFSGMTLALGGLGMHLLISKSEVPIIKLSPQGNMLSLFPIEMVLFVGLIAALTVACYLFYDECRTKIDELDVSTFASIQTFQSHLK